MTDRPTDENARPTPAENAGRPTHPGGFTLDLSGRGPAPKRKAKAAPALVTRTINLSTKPAPAPTPEAAPAPPPAQAAPKPKRETKGDARTEQKRDTRREGHSLADLLDPETLARLRGNG